MLTTKHLLTASAAFAALGMLAANAQAAPLTPVLDKTLLLDDFDGDGLGTGDSGSVNGGFGTFGDTGSYTIEEDAADSTARLTTPNDSGDNAGIVSKSAIDTSQIFTVRWDIDNQNIAGANNEGWFAGLSTDSGGGFGDLEIFVERTRGIEFTADGEIILGDNSFNDVNAFDTDFVEITIDSTGYLLSFDTSGGETSVSGDWTTEGVNFNNLSDANGLTYVTAGFKDRGAKKNNNNPSLIEFDKIQVTTIPEPATAALIGVGGLLLLRRRSRG